MPNDLGRSRRNQRQEPPKQHSRIVQLGAALIFIGLVIWPAMGCETTSTRPHFQGSFVGSYDETIGPEGPTALGFSDAELVQLLLPNDIPPIYEPRFVTAGDANLTGDELVIGLSINGDARAYPTGILFTRELVNDVVGNVPVLISWCPRCYAALVHDRRTDGAVATFGNQGALYRGAMTWFDHETGSIWSQPLGKALAGDRAGETLSLLPSYLTTWAEWRNDQPDTRVLAVSDPASAYTGRRPGEGHVVGVVVGDSAAAWPYPTIAGGATIQATVGGTPVIVWRDDQSGAVRAATSSEPAREPDVEIPVMIAYRSAWLRFYPGTVDDQPVATR